MILLVFIALLTPLATAVSVISRDPPASYGLWSSLGCWGDNPVNRTLHYIAGNSSNNTIESCLDTCQSLGFPLGGTEYSDECYCGNSILYNYGTSNGCSMTCSGDSNEICGGPNAINIYNYNSLPYTVGPASAIFSYDGYEGYLGDVYEGLCYLDGSFGVIGSLKHKPIPDIPIEEMTVENCIEGCKAQGYHVAGLRLGQQCWCDYPGAHENPIGENLPNSACSFPCTGNATEFCGGSYALLAYVNSS